MVVYFYPAAMTPAAPPRQSTSRLPATTSGSRIDVIGISRTPPRSWPPSASARVSRSPCSRTSRADPDAYGAWGTKVLYGKSMEGVLRSTFVIDVDEDGVGRIDLAQYNVRATGRRPPASRPGLLHL